MTKTTTKTIEQQLAPPPAAASDVARKPKSEAEQKRDAQVKAAAFWIDKAKPAIRAALPNLGFTAERFARVALTLVNSNPMLLECEPKTIAIGVIRSAQLGLSLDPLLGESYLIPRWNSKNKRMEASWQRGYRGVAKLIRRTGELSGIRGDVVCENDKFMRTANGDIFHEPFDGDRGKRKGAYVTMYFKDGFVLAHYMPLSEIYAIRDRYSEGYKKYPDSSPWNPSNPITEKWMLIKTVLFQAAHLAPMETEAGQQMVKEAVADNMPADETMDALSSEIFDGEEPIEMTRTNERLSKTEEMAKQLESSAPAGTAAAATVVEKGGEAPIDGDLVDALRRGLTHAKAQTTGDEIDAERETMKTRVVVARDNAFAKLVDADRFVAAKTENKFPTIDALVQNGSLADLTGVLRDINTFVNQRNAVK